ncbi:MAG: hypothetical protein ABL986_17765 [Vicinamibacterales bacterium]
MDEAALIGYVYDDDVQDATAVAAHVATCATCAEEVRALQSTRDELQTWTPPEAVLGFQFVSTQQAPPTVLRPARWWRQPLPAWAQVAAAVALFGAGAALGALRGSAVTPAGISTAVTSAPASGVAPVSAGDLAALEARLRAELAPRGAAPAPVIAASHDDAALMQQVRTLIGESERRQQQELTLRTAELVKDVDAQRRGDLARIERTFGQMEGTTGVRADQQQQLLNYLMRVSQRQPQ